MRHSFAVGALMLASAAAFLTGCPIYPDNTCFDSSACPNGSLCDAYSGQCVIPPNPGAAGMANGRGCVSPDGCSFNETCGPSGFCLPGDCTSWSCVTGFSCTVDSATKKAQCIPTPTPGTGGSSSSTGGASGSAGTGGGATPGGSAGVAGGQGEAEGSTGSSGASGNSGSGGAFAAGASGMGGGTAGATTTTGSAGNSDGSSGQGGSSAGGAAGAGGGSNVPSNCNASGLPAASGSLQLIDSPSLLSSCTGGLSSTPGQGKLRLVGGAIASNETWSFSVDGMAFSSNTIACNSGGITCSFSFQRVVQGQSTTTYSNIPGQPFTVRVTTWTATSFVGTAETMSVVKTVFMPGGTVDPKVENNVNAVFVAAAQ